MKIKSNKSSLFTKYLFLYLITAFIPALTACLSLTLSHKALKNETIHSNMAAVRLIQKSLDIKLSELDKMILTLGEDSSLTSYALKSSPLEAINSLNRTLSQQDFVSNILIVDSNIDYIYSPNGIYAKSDIIHQSFMKDLTKNGYTYQEWLALIPPRTAAYWPINALENMPDYLYLFSPMHNIQNGSYYSSRTVVLLISQEFIHNLFQSSQTIMDENILLLNSNMDLLSMLTQDAPNETVLYICDYLRTNPESFEKGYLELENNLVFLSHSKETGLYYVRFLPQHVTYQTFYQIRNYTSLILAIVVIMGIGLVIIGMKNSYIPIRDSLKENISLTQTINESKQGLTDHLLTALICGNFTTQEAFSNACNNLKILLDRKYFCVCSIIFEDELPENESSIFELIMKCMYDSSPKELLLQAKNLLFARKLLLVLNSDVNDMAVLETAVTSIKGSLFSQHGLRISVGIGSFYDSYDKVGKSYLESVNALDYRLIYGKDCIITPDMHNIFLQEGSYPTQDLELLKSALTSQNTELATSVIHRLNNYTKSKNCDLHSAKHICYDAFSILKYAPTFANISYTNTPSHSLNIMHLSNFDTVDEFFASLLSIVHHTLGMPAENGSTSSDIGNQLVEYIQAHCLSYDFQISNMAEHFSITPQYMRKLFKNHTGVGLSEYISNVKLERAMQLLRETDMPIQDIVLEIGNVDASGFVRSFKTKTGMTPGQYRKSCNTQIM